MDNSNHHKIVNYDSNKYNFGDFILNYYQKKYNFNNSLKYIHEILNFENIPKEKTFQYGIVDGKSLGNKLIQINTIIEKPKPEDAPSTMGVIGRYIFSPLIIDLLEKVKPGKSGEIQLTDAIQLLLNHESVYAYNFEGVRYDCGDKLGFMKANIEFSKKHPEIGIDFVQYLKSLS